MLSIAKITSDSTVDFAAEELKKYLRMMMPEGGDIAISYAPEAKDGFRLGLMCELGLDTSDAENATLDDIIYIDCDTEGGVIAGSNYRSVLLAVYEYLRQNGCRWLFPGVDGEYIPMQDIKPIKYRHKADSRIRGNCIEGATGQQMLIDFIDFLPKVGLNSFMIQFKNPKSLYDRFYEHSHNTENRPAEPITKDQVAQWSVSLECEIAKRALFLHYCGHGFTTDPFGIDSAMGWSKVDGSLFSDDVMKYFAKTNGERKFFKNQPMNTQLCMTNREARKKVVDYVVDYSKHHSNIDYLHVWLADDYNNHCECEECSKHRPSDLYVVLMNEIDDALTAAGLDTKIVVIVYVDTFWAPIKEKLHEGDRFILMVAPIFRDFTMEYDVNAPLPALRPYERNKLKMPESLEESIAYYKEWKNAYQGDRFVFEYHFWKHMHYDLSGKMLARRIYNDVKAYRELGEQGIIECGSQRAFFPNGFAFYTHARALFDASLSLEDIERDYYTTAYGEVSEKISSLLGALSDAVPFDYISDVHAVKRPEGYKLPDFPERISKALAVKDELISVIRDNYNSDIRLRTVSIRILEAYCTYLDKLLAVFDNLSRGNVEATNEAMAEFDLTAGKIELEFEGIYDHGQASGIIEWRILRLFNK